MSGLSVRTIQRLERGHKASLESAKSLAAVFEVDFHTFYSEDAAMNTPTNNTPQLSSDEQDAMRYAKGVKDFAEGLLAYLILALVFLVFLGARDPVVYWVFLGVGAGLVVQGLIAFEVIRFDRPSWEKWLVERRLGRKL